MPDRAGPGRAGPGRLPDSGPVRLGVLGRQVCDPARTRPCARWVEPNDDPLRSPTSGPLSGTVVEIGPGFGETIQLYADPARTTSLVLVEPNEHMHARLRAAALAAGLPPARVPLLPGVRSHPPCAAGPPPPGPQPAGPRLGVHPWGT